MGDVDRTKAEMSDHEQKGNPHPDSAAQSDLSNHEQKDNPHSDSASATDLSNHAGDANAHHSPPDNTQNGSASSSWETVWTGSQDPANNPISTSFSERPVYVVRFTCSGGMSTNFSVELDDALLGDTKTNGMYYGGNTPEYRTWEAGFRPVNRVAVTDANYSGNMTVEKIEIGTPGIESHGHSI